MWPKYGDVPLAHGVHRYDPETELVPGNEIGRMGWPGYFPTTPCRNCHNEYFRWVGDWNLGFYCVVCRQTWRVQN